MIDASNRTKLLRRTLLRQDDEQLVRMIATLPGSQRERTRTVGILNEQGSVYREVNLYSLFEVLHFSARMNSMGFSVWRRCGPRDHCRHEIVFADSVFTLSGTAQQ